MSAGLFLNVSICLVLMWGLVGHVRIVQSVDIFCSCNIGILDFMYLCEAR